MAIADTINSMYENVGEVYDTITNVDLPTNKNIENIPSTIRKSYLDIMNNGYQDIYDNWEKVNGTGTSLTLNNTEEAPMTIGYKGNTYQETTTGKNIWNLGSLSNTTQAGVTLKQDTDGGFLLNGTSTGVGRFKIALNTDINEVITLYLKSFNNSGDIMISLRDTNDTQLLSMRNDNVLKVYSYTPTAPIRYIELIQLTSGVQYTNYKIYPMIVKGSYTSSTIGNYEPYTNGASPNPTYPQDIHIVSGDNYINVCGKNLLKYPYMNTTSTVSGVTFTDNGNGSITINGTSTSSTYSLWFFYENAWSYNGLSFELEPGTYTFKALGTDKVSMPVNIYFSDNTHEYFAIYNNDVTKTITEKVKLNMRLLVTGGVSVNNVTIYPQIEKGNQATTYETYKSASYSISLGEIELCKIGTYQDRIFKSSGKNLFDKNTITSGYRLDNNGIANGSASNEFTSDFIEVKSGKTYIRNYGDISAYTRTCFYDKNKSFVSKNDDSQSFTIPDNVKYIRFSEYLSRLDTMQFEKGSSTTPYEPYGKDWYLNKQIGKVVLNGSENGWFKSGTNSYNSFGTGSSNLNIPTITSDSMCSHFAYATTNRNNSYWYGSNNLYLVFPVNSDVNNLELFKTWLGNNNTSIYYVLATPTYEKITGELLNQLEAIKKSYENQTNINQENNDLPFELEVGALKKY